MHSSLHRVSRVASLPSSHTDRSAWILGPIRDRLLRLRRPYRAQLIADIRAGLHVFPDIAGRDRAALLRGIVLNDAFIRTVFRVQKTAPAVASMLARCIPIADPSRAFANVPAHRPIILALMHFGPVHFALDVLKRATADRTIYVVHAGGDDAHAVSTYLRRIGTIPLVSGDSSLRFLVRAMREDPHCVVVLAFDHLGSVGRSTVPFLGGTVSPARGLAYLADLRDAAVIPAWAEFTPKSARVVVQPALAIDRELDKARRQERMNRELFLLAERRVRAFPHLWTEWQNCGAHAQLRKVPTYRVSASLTSGPVPASA